jgi:acetylornithine deacetylase/succinyl-diaminopimelate desuccinylase-like protein
VPDEAGAGRALVFAQGQRARFVSELQEFIRFPTVSSQPLHEPDLTRCANWLAAHLRRVGADDVQVIPTRGHPLVYGYCRGPARAPTVLLYGHYDVQPVDPLSEWRIPPFAAAVRDGYLYGRGACDDKGQMFTHVKALESYLRTSGLPVTVKCLYEGEEEMGSTNLLPFVARHGRELAADVAVISDTRMLGPGRPAINYSERGALYIELEVAGPAHDLHSGNFGGAVHNPLQGLCEIVAALHTPDGHIAVPGIYDRVRPWSGVERRFMARSGPGDARILEMAGVPRGDRGWGESNFSAYEKLTIRPALTVNGLNGGYRGPGSKGVIPARASAKLSFRLVPDQDPLEIERLFRARIAELTPPTLRSTVRRVSAARPVVIGRGHPAMRAAAAALDKGFGAAPVFLRSGGTIPVLETFQRVLGIPSILLGFALSDDRIHAPNERFHLTRFFRGIATSIWFLANLARQVSSGVVLRAGDELGLRSRR